MKLNYTSLLVVLVALALYAGHLEHTQWTPQRLLGVLIAVPSFLLFVMARTQLGDAFSVQAKASKLVTTGLYSRLRNPIYLFSGTLIAGMILIFGYPWFLLIFAIVVPLQIVRARSEERLLAAHFGHAYTQYKASTWF